jgi:preprotein translocase subunit SecG
MNVLTVLCYTLIVVVALLLIGLIMIQPSKSGGMGAAFGGIGEAFGGKAGSHLTKTTVIMTAIFFIVALALAAFIGHGGGVKTASSTFSEALTQEEPAAVEAAKAEAPKTEKK